MMVVSMAMMTMPEKMAATTGGTGVGRVKRPASSDTTATTISTAPRPFIPTPIARLSLVMNFASRAGMPQLASSILA